MSWIKRGGLGSGWLQVVILFVSLSLSLYPCVGHTAPGELDLSFGSNGIVTTAVVSGSCVSSAAALALAIQPDGKIVVAGSSYGQPFAGMKNLDVTVVRYYIDGKLDPGFGINGVVTTDLGGNDQAYALAIQSDGKIVVGGTASNIVNDFDFAVVRYNGDGNLDPGFGTNGVVTTDLGGNDEAQGVAIQSNGKIVMAGTFQSLHNKSYDTALVRYNSTGKLDKNFGSKGKVINDISGNGGNDLASAVAIQSDGKIVVAGRVHTGTGDTLIALTRYIGDRGAMAAEIEEEEVAIEEEDAIDEGVEAATDEEVEGAASRER